VSALTRFRFEYGAGPFHLLVALASFAVAGWGLAQVFGAIANTDALLLWLFGSIILHDLVLLPLYSALGVVAAGGIAHGTAQSSRMRVAALNHLRVPVLLSGLMLLVWFPLVLETAPASFARAAGYEPEVYLERWLGLTAVLLVGSALVFALRARRLGDSA
jgi:hypothetical protein